MARPRSNIGPRIVRAARKQFLASGVDGASLRTIARSAKTSIGMIYYYFPTKDDLFLAVVEETYLRILGRLEAALAGNDSVDRRLRRAFAVIGALDDEELQVIRLVVREALVSSTRLDRIVERSIRGHVPLVFAAIADGVEKKQIEPSLPLPLVIMCCAGVGVVPQLMARVAQKRIPFELPSGDALADVLVDVLFHGIGPRS
jgi:AcrR family transcriptional regulator